MQLLIDDTTHMHQDLQNVYTRSYALTNCLRINLFCAEEQEQQQRCSSKSQHADGL